MIFVEPLAIHITVSAR